jgi:hypothetical protein
MVIIENTLLIVSKELETIVLNETKAYTFTFLCTVFLLNEV